MMMLLTLSPHTESSGDENASASDGGGLEAMEELAQREEARKMKASLRTEVHEFCLANQEIVDKTISSEFKLLLTDVAMDFLANLAGELQSNAAFAKRKSVTADDVIFCARNAPVLQQKLQQFKAHYESKEKKKALLAAQQAPASLSKKRKKASSSKKKGNDGDSKSKKKPNGKKKQKKTDKTEGGAAAVEFQVEETLSQSGMGIDLTGI
jgi:histone H3/H4